MLGEVSGDTHLVHLNLPLVNVGSERRPQWLAAEVCMILPFQPYTEQRPDRAAWMQQMMLRCSTARQPLQQARLETALEPVEGGAVMPDLQYKMIPATSTSPVDRSSSSAPVYCVLRIVTSVKDSTTWPSDILNTLTSETPAPGRLTTLSIDRFMSRSDDWELSLHGFIAKQASITASEKPIVLVLCLPAHLSLQSGQPNPYNMLKAFCDVELGVPTFFINKKSLQGAKVDKRDMFGSTDARVKRAAVQIRTRSEKRQQRQLLLAESRLAQKRPLDLAVGVHMTLIRASTSKDFTHVLLTVASRDLAVSGSYSTWVRMYGVADMKRMLVELDGHSVSLFPRQVPPSEPHRLTLLRSGALFNHAGAELLSLIARLTLDGKLVAQTVIEVSEDKSFTGQVLSSEGTAVRERTLDLSPMQDPQLLIAGHNSGLEAASFATQASAPALSASAATQANAETTLPFDTVQSLERSTPLQPQPVPFTMHPEDMMRRLATLWRDDALGLLPTCKWPVPTYLARCAADRALLHLKAFSPKVQLCASVTTAAGISATRTIDADEMRCAKQDKTLQSTTAAETSTDVTNIDGLIFRPVHSKSRDTLYYL
ncbi:hypothetical protein LTR95_007131 [Oleoguttula sp. CCFEE 5521]